MLRGLKFCDVTNGLPISLELRASAVILNKLINKLVNNIPTITYLL